ncbi:MAG TPA: LysR substrate-binding domain-containing protein [Oscillatoriaceae cyanobacterium]
MNIDQLKTFVIAADELNFTRAAEILHLTQPAVSQQIKELENFFGVPLFERRGRQVQLSVGGERLRPYARHILSQVDEARSLLSELGGRTYGKLLVGSGNTVGIYLLPQLLGDFQREYPDVVISLKVAETSEVVEMLSHGELDLALLEESPNESRLRHLTRVPFLRDELVLVAPPAKLAVSGQNPGATISVDELYDLPIIMRQPTSRTRQLIWSRMSDAGVDIERLRVTLEFGNTEAIKQAAMAGLGCGWISTLAVRKELASGLLRVVNVEGLSIQRQLWLVVQQTRYLPERVKRFQAFLLERAEGLQSAVALG